MPSYWQKFIQQHELTGRELSVPPASDMSGLGALIEILDERDCRIEQTDLYPGIAVAKDGFIPVGNCAIGTGDPYFINVRDGEGGPLYRIYHEEVVDENYDAARAIAVVLGDYRELLTYAGTKRCT